MVNGLMHQLTNRVKNIGLPLLPALTISPKSILTMMGYIMKNKQMAMGMDTTGAPLTKMASPSRYWATPGAIFPSKMPATMHSTTHRDRNRSKILVIFRSLFKTSSLLINRILRVIIKNQSKTVPNNSTVLLCWHHPAAGSLPPLLPLRPPGWQNILILLFLLPLKGRQKKIAQTLLDKYVS